MKEEDFMDENTKRGDGIREPDISVVENDDGKDDLILIDDDGDDIPDAAVADCYSNGDLDLVTDADDDGIIEVYVNVDDEGHAEEIVSIDTDESPDFYDDGVEPVEDCEVVTEDEVECLDEMAVEDDPKPYMYGSDDAFDDFDDIGTEY